jgi:DNA-binding transcriptional MerR regulator
MCHAMDFVVEQSFRASLMCLVPSFCLDDANKSFSSTSLRNQLIFMVLVGSLFIDFHIIYKLRRRVGMSDMDTVDEDADAGTENNNTEAVTKVDDDLVDKAVVFINETTQRSIYVAHLEIGEYILKHFFNDDIKLAASRDPNKKTSFNALCKREDLEVHPNRLGIMVRVASQARFLTDKEVETKALSYTHKSKLVKLPNDEEKLKVIKQCIDEGWSTRALQEHVKEITDGKSNQRAPSLIQKTAGFLKKVEGVLKVDVTILDIDDVELSKMDEGKREKLEKKLASLKKKIEDNAEKSKTISKGCDALLKRLAKISGEGKQEATEAKQ